MFKALVASGLNGFLGCMSEIFETALVEFYQNASTVQGKSVEISEEVFSRTFQLPMEGLTDMNEVPKDLVFDARTEFSFTGDKLTTSCKKRELKIEFRLLSDILAKLVIVKAGSFDVVTHERFLMMTAINAESTKLGFGRFQGVPTSKILTARTVGRYMSINDKIYVEDVEDVGDVSPMKKTPAKRVVSKKRPAVAVDEHVVKKKRTFKGKAAPSKEKLELVSVAQEAIPLQIVAPIPAVSTVPPPKPKQKAPKRKLKLTPASDDETVAKDANVGAVEKQGEGTTADVENYNNLTTQLGELVDYIHPGGNDKKGEESSSRRPQPPPDDQNRPSGGSASRGGGGSGGRSRRDDRTDSSKKIPSSSGGGSGTGGETYGPYGPYNKNAEWWLYGKNQF
ncbi:hypothetical protein F511_17741 [Dorcoceras hygrometricum]|uniref:Uncharacterized protein n=1 Tax=Dorcoceras hygrometricum TaxID=472368 RepID=A0A2Z7C4I9_9LAMI|nr:hypothetical protein F511_17741 [Dorcoceras hygrometricum]